MNKIATENDLDITSTSAGIFATIGNKSSKNAVKAMIDYDINIQDHTSNQLTEELISQNDLILTMTEGHKTMISTLAPEKIFTITEYAGYTGDIMDPYGGNINEYKQCAEDIYDCLTEIAEKIYDMQNGNTNED